MNGKLTAEPSRLSVAFRGTPGLPDKHPAAEITWAGKKVFDFLEGIAPEPFHMRSATWPSSGDNISEAIRSNIIHSYAHATGEAAPKSVPTTISARPLPFRSPALIQTPPRYDSS